MKLGRFLSVRVVSRLHSQIYGRCHRGSNAGHLKWRTSPRRQASRAPSLSRRAPILSNNITLGYYPLVGRSGTQWSQNWRISICSDRAKKGEIRLLCMYVDTLRINFLARASCPGSMSAAVAAMLDIGGQARGARRRGHPHLRGGHLHTHLGNALLSAERAARIAASIPVCGGWRNGDGRAGEPSRRSCARALARAMLVRSVDT